MTPLEELQAAHKRLSELRNLSTPDPWRKGQDADVDGGGLWLFEAASHDDARLIVTLHRTIDAQLRLLESEIGLGTVPEDWHGDAREWWLAQPLDQFIIDLARAINGEAS